MKRFPYKIVVKSWKLGTAEMFTNPSNKVSVTLHHAGVDCNEDSSEKRIKTYAYYHIHVKGKKGIAYQFVIPCDDNDPYIYITMYLDGVTWNASNFILNHKNIAVLVDGNYEKEYLSVIKKLKIKQLLDDIANNWFSKNGYIPFDKNINPKESRRVIVVSKTWEGFSKVPPLNFHEEVAQPGWKTQCPGKNAIPYVKEYREKHGNVDWGDHPVDPCSEFKKEIEDLEGNLKLCNIHLQDCGNEKKKLQQEILNRDEIIKKMQSRYDKLSHDYHTLYKDYKNLQKKHAFCIAIRKLIDKILTWIASWLRKDAQEKD